jgi:hypothetical protein
LQINEGDHVFLTMDGQEIGSDKGTVIELTPKSIVVELRVPVKVRKHHVNNAINCAFRPPPTWNNLQAVNASAD